MHHSNDNECYLHGMIPLDSEGSVSGISYAVVYVPKRSRSRFSANCVQIKTCADDARHAADPDNKYFAARVSGPSKSSEGQMIYYLLEWLE